jgi:hypothetical protein
VLIFDDFVKLSHTLIYDAQCIMLLKIVIDTNL